MVTLYFALSQNIVHMQINAGHLTENNTVNSF